MPFFKFFRRLKTKVQPITKARPKPRIVPRQATPSPTPLIDQQASLDIRRYFHNERHFQCYTTWFAYWGGWVSAGHCLTEAQDHLPEFANGSYISKWPDGLDAALVGCTLPSARPPGPAIGQNVILLGYPAGSRNLESRKGRVYFERSPGQWIVHIFDPDEPVVTGMSGGPVLDSQTRKPIGITITRNSPADLNNDRDPDESADFIALSSVWDAVSTPQTA